MPNDPSLSCDGVVSNNLGAGSGVTNAASCGFPSSGAKYFAAFARGPVAVTPGGPVARPVSLGATEVRIPIPAGSTLISLSWEFFNAEGGPQTTYNDGMSIDVVDSTGVLIANLAYADTHSALAGGACGIAGEIAPLGPQPLVAALPLMSLCSYVSVVVWNGGDNSFVSRLLLDNVVFDSALAACQVPCVPVIGTPTLVCTSPLVAGSLQVDMSSLPPGGSYFIAATLNAGAFPAGWFYGVDIPLSELQAELNMGAPFTGPVSAAPCTAGKATIGPIFGIPSGLTFYMVALGLSSTSLSGTPSAVTNAVGYTIP
jgi:hypothetical protein